MNPWQESHGDEDETQAKDWDWYDEHRDDEE